MDTKGQNKLSLQQAMYGCFLAPCGIVDGREATAACYLYVRPRRRCHREGAKPAAPMATAGDDDGTRWWLLRLSSPCPACIAA